MYIPEEEKKNYPQKYSSFNPMNKKSLQLSIPPNSGYFLTVNVC